MSARAELILQQLGITRWIRRDDPVTALDQQQIWVDCLAAATGLTESVEDPDIDRLLQMDQPATSVVDPPEPVLPVDLPDLEPVQDELPNQLAAAQHNDSTADMLAQAGEADIPVTLNLAVMWHARFVMVGQIENPQQHELWMNIQKACQAQPLTLQWPLDVTDWPAHPQALRGYIAGFLAGLQERALLTLGDLNLPQLEEEVAPQHRYPSLADLLEYPDQKKSLWHELKPLLN